MTLEAAGAAKRAHAIRARGILRRDEPAVGPASRSIGRSPGPGCILVETPRRTMVKLMNSNEEVRSGIDWIFVVRELQRHFVPFGTLQELRGHRRSRR